MATKLIVLIAIMLICLFLRFPLYAAFLIAGISIGVIYPDFMPMTVVGTGMASGLGTVSLASIIFFFFAGELMTRGGIAEKIVRFFRACIGHVRGALSHINILESVVFAGVSGSSMADSVAMCNLLVPAMEKDGYETEYAAAVTLASSNLGPIIPPSGGLILLAIYCEANTQHVIMGGLVPGLVIAAVMMCYSIYISRKRNYPKGEWMGFRKIFTTLKDTVFALIMPVIVIVCLSLGLGTVEEVGAGICFYCLLVGLLIDRDLTLKDVWQCAVNTAKSVGKLLSISAACSIFNWIIASMGLRTMIQTYMAPLVAHPLALMFTILVIYLIGGCFMSHMVLLLVVAPLLAPLATAAGYNIISFCVLTMLACNMGQITPPVGQLIFVGASVCKCDAMKIVRELIPFIIVLLISAVLLILFPQIAYALPKFLYSR